MPKAHGGSRCACRCVWGWYSISGCEENNDSVAGIVLSWTVPAATSEARTRGNPELGIRAREGKAGGGKPTPITPQGSPATVHLPLWATEGGGAPKGEEAPL